MLQKLLIVAALVSAGCSGVNQTNQGRLDPYPRSQIMFDTTQLRNDTAVGVPIVTRDDAGLLHVQVPIRSAINVTLYVDYRVTWFDRNGQKISTFGPFTKTLDPNTPDQIVVNSTTSQAADFQVDFRYAR